MSDLVPRHRRIDLPDRGGAVAAYELGPEDRPIDVVFSHANSFNALTYRTVLAPAAAEGLRILAYDMRGHGDATLPTEADARADWSDLAEDLLALLETLDLEGVILAGHSMGATSTLLAAARTPQRVRALALFEPVVLARHRSGPADGTDEMIEKTLKRRSRFESREAAAAGFEGRGTFHGWSRAALDDYVEAGLKPAADGGFMLACSPDWETSNYRTQCNDVWPILDRLAVPTRILKADGYSSVEVEGEVEALTRSGHVRLDLVERTSHFLPLQRPAVVTETLLRLASETAPVA